MKGSNIKRKVGRLTFSACALLFAGGMFVACEDELLTGMPSWLGSSIYDELAQRGNYQTTMRLINDPDISTVGTDGQTEYRRLLGLTGSKTLFVANDEAYSRFFADNDWGVTSYDGLSAAQKRLLFKSSMVNSAYLIELMSSLTNNTADPTEGAVMRRETELSLYDSVPRLHASDMPENNKFWSYYRSKYPDNGEDAMLIMRDNTVSPMVHYLTDFMRTNQITNDDLSFLTNGSCDNISEAYINGQRLTERDITCQNGYLQVVENVMAPLTNMAEVIRNDEDLSIFSSFLDRFSVPVYNESLTNSYGQTNSSGQVDSVFVWRYFNDGFGFGTDNYNALTSYRNEQREDLLPYDPGWNRYANGASARSYNQDMGVIIAPTNAAFNAFFQEGGGASLIDRYKVIDSIPDNIIIDMMDNFMKYSLVATVPSKFSTVTNTAQMEMGLSEEKIDECLMANNGVVFKANEVFSIPEYQSVSFPASLDDNIRIMRLVMSDADNCLNYQAYLNSMNSEYIFVLPTDDALANYVDPVRFGTRPVVARFYYDASTSYTGFRVRVNLFYGMQDSDGSWVADESQPIANPWSDTQSPFSGYSELSYIKDRLEDVLENSIYVKDRELSASSGQSVWVSKGGCPIILEGSGESIRITTAFRKELAGNVAVLPESYILGVRSVDGYYNMGSNPGGNGETYIVDKEPVMSATKSVPTVLKELSATNPDYDEFKNLLMNSSLVSDLYDYGAPDDEGNRTAKTVSNDTTINIMENFNYTVYVPRSSEIEKMYDAGLLPRWQYKLELQRQYAANPGDTELQKRLQEVTDSIDNFIRYHIQNNAIYQNGVSRSGSFETSYMPSNRFSTLNVNYTSGGDFTVICRDDQGNDIENGDGTPVTRTVVGGNYFAREFHFRGPTDNSAVTTQDDACSIYNSSMCVIHLLDKPLLYSQNLADRYATEIGD